MTLAPRMRSALRRGALSILRAGGAFRVMQDSAWRRDRLLILCYHGISLEDEHQWQPALYIRPEQFERRLKILRESNSTVLPLDEALERLRHRDLPPRSVAITFDDGTYDFYERAYPRLRENGFPATVYLTTYYTDRPVPVFHLICSYILWKARDRSGVDLSQFGLSNAVATSSPLARRKTVEDLTQWAKRENLTCDQKNEMAGRVAKLSGVDFQHLVRKRILQLMNSQELREIAAAGLDLQLHTHRHRTPRDADLFRKEIRDNRDSISRIIPGDRKHFCYPSGVYWQEFLGWLAADGVVSATTCDTGFATPESNPLLLPRLVDTSGKSDLEFESWLNGIGHFLSLRRPAHTSD